MSWFTLSDDAARRKSRSAWIAMAAFWVSAFKVLFHGAVLTIWGNTITFGTIDAALLGAFLAPCLALYWGRRYTDAVSALRNGPAPGGTP